MFQRILHEHWVTIVAIFAFAVTAVVFLFVSIRALRLPKKRREHLANLPLEDDKNHDSTKTSSKSHV